MPSTRATVDYLLDQLAGAGQVSARAMFGEFGIYCDGKMAAMVCDDVLYVKATPEGRAFAGAIEEGIPYPGAKPALAPSAAQIEDADWLSAFVRITAAALPAPKPKAAKKKRTAE